MKQTVEEAANDYLQKILEASDFEINFEEDNYDAGARDAVLDVTERAYIAGAEWQANQSPWRDTTEKPVQGKLCLVEYKDPNGEIRVRLDKHCGFEWKEMCHYDRILRWAYVDDLKPPTFDQILEANKDVLQRMKEKGD